MLLGELLLGALGARLLWLASRDVFGGYVFQRLNYRDHPLPTAVGLLIPVVAAAFLALSSLVGSRRGLVLNWDSLLLSGHQFLGLMLGFGLLGLVDDIGGVGQSGGFRGHLRSLRTGHLTTGALKLVGGPLIAIVMLGESWQSADRVALLRDAALICLSANLANLFDRAPGRVIKAGTLAFMVAWITVAAPASLAPVALVIGASLGLLVPDLREELMLGDAGANVIGAALGYGVVVSVSEWWRWGALVVVALANLVSERVSFTRVIDAVPPLRWLDRFGAPHREK